jgi:selenocysteine-specific translation elongation factor
MQGRLLGVFGTNPSLKNSFLGSVAKKSEAEGITVFHRVEGGIHYSFLDDAQFPEKLQGYSRIASIADFAYYILPKFGKITPPDGELAVLLDSFGLEGSILAIDEEVPQALVNFFKGTRLENYSVETRSSQSSVIKLSNIENGKNSHNSGTLVYVDRAFSVKGIGVVVLGFVLSGKISIHDELRLIPSQGGKKAEVRGIQVSDVDQESVERGIRIGLSLKGVELKDLAKVAWLDDGTFQLQDALSIEYTQSKFYKQPVDGRDLHLQLPGEILTCKLKVNNGNLTASLPNQVPVWEGMRAGVIDLNAKNLRVTGGGVCGI